MTDLQIREVYLVEDLAQKADGAFSVSYGRFIKMFEERFEMEISLSFVRRFFGLLSKIGVLTISEAKRKNNKRSANIYIIEPSEEATEHVEEYSIEQTLEHIEEHRQEHNQEHIDEHYNITNKNTINIPLTTSNSEFIDNQLKDKYPHVPFEEIKQQVLYDDSLTIDNVNQYKGILEYKLKRWKPNKKKITRTELLPYWFDEDSHSKKTEKSEISPDEVERQKSEIKDILASLKEEV